MSKSFDAGFDLTGKTALVTGAAAGIGLAVAELFAAQGARVVLLDRDPSVRETAAGLAGQTHHLGVVCDLADASSIDRAVQQAVAHGGGGVDILVNNAGVVFLAPALELSEADWDITMAINLKAAFLLSRAVAPSMRVRGGGRIVNLASQAALVALDRHVAYCAGKAALVSMTQVLAVEWAQYGITVNAVSPTVVETALGRKAWAGPVGDAMKQKIPVGRFAQPDEIASAILYLASQHAGIITGSNMVVDGGYTVQ